MATLLLIDDLDLFRESLGRKLRVSGHMVYAPANLADVCDVARTIQLDWVLLDWFLWEGIRGGAVYEKLLEIQPDLSGRVILLTGGAGMEEIEKFSRDSGCPIWEKLLSPEQMNLIGSH